MRVDIEVAATALARNPANVIATCIVDKNLFGSSYNFNNSFAFFLPSWARTFILFLFTETMAISAEAKNAFISMRNANNNS
jgi:hypothetical protein